MATATVTKSEFDALNRSWLSSMATEERAATGYTHKVIISAKDIADKATSEGLTGTGDELTFTVMNLAQAANSDSAITDCALIVSEVWTASTAGTFDVDVGDGAGTATLLAAIVPMTTGTGLPKGTATYATLPDDETPLVDVNGGTHGTAAGAIYVNVLSKAVSSTYLTEFTGGELTLFLKVRESANIIN